MFLDHPLIRIILDEVLAHQSNQEQLPPMQAPHERRQRRRMVSTLPVKEAEVLAVRTEPPEPFDPDDP
jgi:hypothetical protein